MKNIEIRDTRKGNWFWVENLILTDYLATIGMLGFTLYSCLAMLSKGNSQVSSSYNELAKTLDVTPRTIIKTIKILSEVGLIGIDKRLDQHTGYETNLYTLLAVKPLENNKNINTFTNEARNISPSELQNISRVTNEPKITTLVNLECKNSSFANDPRFTSLKKEEEKNKKEEKEEKETDISHSLNVKSFSQSLLFDNSKVKESATKQDKQDKQDKQKPETPNPQPVKPEKVAKTKAPADVRCKHPAIIAVRELIGRYPDKLTWDDIIDVLGETPDLEKLKQCAKTWARKTTNIANLDTWLFDWYINGLPLSTYQNLNLDNSTNNLQKEFKYESTKREKPSSADVAEEAKRLRRERLAAQQQSS